MRTVPLQDATALAFEIGAGALSPRTAMAAAWDRAAATRGACARLLPRAEALEAASRAASGPFHGVPMLGKDLGGAARGLAPAGGSAALRRRLPDPAEDDAFFARLRGGGLVPFGLTTVPEFGMALTSSPPGVPPAANPFDKTLSAGGSSGGAALAVASGVVAVAHATDAAGSIRVPAACCGLWGLKPSRGATPMGPHFANHLMGLVSEFALARSLRDVSALFSLFRRPPGPRAVRRHRIALCLPQRCDPARRRAAEEAAETLARAGAEILRRPAPDALGAECARIAGIVLTVSLAEWLTAMQIPDKELSPFARAARTHGAATPGTAVFAAAREIARLSERAWTLFGDVDAILSPVLSGPPPALDAFPNEETEIPARLARMEATAPNIALANVAGLPALAFPAGMAGGLPAGAQLIGPPGSEYELLTMAAPLAQKIAPPFPSLAGMP